MADFDDAFGVPVPPADDTVPGEDGADPAADFLAREQEELGELGQELGLDAPTMTVTSDPEMEDLSAAVTSDLGDMKLDHERVSPAPHGGPKMPKEEPETIKKWREEHAQRLEEKDKEEEKKMEELREQAKKELGDWYKHYEEQLSKTKATNRECEKEFVAEVNDITPGTEWERVTNLVDFNTKNSKSTKDMSRMRSILLQLKQSPLKKDAS